MGQTPFLAVIAIVLLGVVVVGLLFLLFRRQRPANEIMDQPVYQDLDRFVLIDRDTGLYNRRFFQKKVDEEIYRSRRYGSYFSLTIINLPAAAVHLPDHDLNVLLRKLGSTMTRDTRFTDVVARVDRGQLGILFPMTAKRGAEIPASRLEQKVEEMLRSAGIETRPEVRLFAFPEESTDVERFSEELKVGLA